MSLLDFCPPQPTRRWAVAIDYLFFTGEGHALMFEDAEDERWAVNRALTRLGENRGGPLSAGSYRAQATPLGA